MKCQYLGEPLYSCDDWYLCPHKCTHPDQPEGEVVVPREHCELCPFFIDKNHDHSPIIVCDKPLPRGKLIKTSQLIQDTIILCGALPVDITGVVGVPRSGMIPASVVSTHLHLPLGEFRNNHIHWLNTGWRGQSLQPGDKYLFIDDTVYEGHALSKVRSIFGPNHIYGAVYVRPQAAYKKLVDICYGLLPTPHFLEWNLLNSGFVVGQVVLHLKRYIREGIGSDFDGVIVHDDMSGGIYHTPYLISKRAPVPLVITGRGIDEMEPTLQLIAKYNINIRSLVMRPLHVPNNLYDIAKWKASVFKQHPNLGLYIESSAYQAKIIAEECEETKQYVLCIEDGHLRLGKQIISEEITKPLPVIN